MLDQSKPSNAAAQAALDVAPTEYRLRLRRAGFDPLPVSGKQVFLEGWSTKTNTSENDIRLWGKLWPDWTNTGVLTRLAPAIDLDITNPEAAEAVEELARERFEERGHILVRIGKAPKRAILLRTLEPFKKLSAGLIAPNGDTTQKIEILGNGQQLVVAGIHPETGLPYNWHGGEPGKIKLDELPDTSADEARAFLDEAVELLVRDFGYRRDGKPAAGNGHGTTANGATDAPGERADWNRLVANIHAGAALHDSTRDLAAAVVARGLDESGTTKLLRSLMLASNTEHDARWQQRFGDIPKLVASAAGKFGKSSANGFDCSAAILSLEHWLARELPASDFIMGHWLTTTSRVLLTAPTGLGKTMFGIAVSFAVAAGMPFLRWDGRRPCRVLYIDGEMSRRLMKRRLAEEIERSGLRPAGLHVFSHEDVEGFQPLSTKAGQAQIEAVIARIGGLDLVVFDNVMSLIGGDMKDEESWRQTLPWLKTLTKRSIGQIWVHHTGHDETRSYGTKTREWQLDTTIFLEPVRRADTDVSFALTFRKARERTPETRAGFAYINIALVDNAWTYSGATAATKRKPSPTGQSFLKAFFNCDTIIRNGRQCVANEAWQAECMRLGLIGRDAKPNVARALFSKYRRELVTCNEIACDNDLSWRV